LDEAAVNVKAMRGGGERRGAGKGREALTCPEASVSERREYAAAGRDKERQRDRETSETGDTDVRQTGTWTGSQIETKSES
jgi:hypothetical protein